MNSRSIIALALLGLLLISSIDAAKKPTKGKKEGNVVKVLKVEKKAVVEEKPAVEAAAEEEGVSVDTEQAAPKISRPKTLKVLTAYDKCKQECRKIRDQEDVHVYVAQLREELAAAEAALEAAATAEESQNVAA